MSAYAAEAVPDAKATQPASTQTVRDNTKVTIDYTLTVDGAVVDASTKEHPFSYVHGRHQIVPGLEQALAGLKAGDSKKVTVTPELGYGAVNPQMFVEVDRSHLPKDVEPKVGMGIQGHRADGGMFMGRIHEVKASGVVLDLNHPLAGKTLVFQVTVTGIEPATEAAASGRGSPAAHQREGTTAQAASAGAPKPAAATQ